MRRWQFLLIAFIAGLALAAALNAAPPLHRASGGGTVIFEGIGTEAYGFNAKLTAAGEVKGQGEFHFVVPVVNFHAEMNCLAVDGDTAWLGMEVTRTDDPDTIPVGFDWTWQIRDNGEGAGAPPDQQSFFFPTAQLRDFGFDADDCNDMPPLFDFPDGVFDWTNGNLQVR